MSESVSHQSREHELVNVPKVFLEVGPWRLPAAATSSRHFTGNNVYIGLEHNSGIYHDPTMFNEQKQHVGERLKQENIHLIQGDGREMPLPDASVHEVFMGNVLNGIAEEDIVPILREVNRVMDGTGPLIIDSGDTTDAYFLDDVQYELEQQGFAVKGVFGHDGDDKNWNRLREVWPSEWPGAPEHNFIVAHKVADPAV